MHCSCHNECAHTPESCNWYTYDYTESLCLLWDSCDDIIWGDAESGEYACPVCELPGICTSNHEGLFEGLGSKKDCEVSKVYTGPGNNVIVRGCENVAAKA